MVAFGKAIGGGRREGSREAAPLGVLMSTVSRTYTAELIDISATGARVRSKELPGLGHELSLAIEGMKTFCTVRWKSGTDCGVQFYEPLLQKDVIAVRRLASEGLGLDPETRAAMNDWVLGIAR